MSVPFSPGKANGQAARESRRHLLKDRALYADADNTRPELQPVWQDSAISSPRALTIAAPNFLVRDSPVSCFPVVPVCAITKAHLQTFVKKIFLAQRRKGAKKT